MNKYYNLHGADFLIAYFKDLGITDEEISLYASWKGFWGIAKTLPNEEGLAYAKERAGRIIDYRSTTLDQILEDEDCTPWAWPTAESFQPILTPDRIPQTNEDVYGIYSCIYNCSTYYFGIGKEEVQISQDMIANGKWYVYTFCD